MVGQEREEKKERKEITTEGHPGNFKRPKKERINSNKFNFSNIKAKKL